MSPPTAEAPGISSPLTFDPWDHNLIDDPYPTYARLRAAYPLFHNPEHDFWVLSRHADIFAALHADDWFSNAMGVSLDKSAWGPHASMVMSFLAMDPPRHKRLRSLISKGFTPKRVAQMEPQVQALTDRYLDATFAGRGPDEEFDWTGEFAGKLPMDVISEMVGVPESDRAEVRRLADLLVAREHGLRDVPPAGIQASLTLLHYYTDHVNARLRGPTEDLTSALLRAEVEGERMSPDEVIAFLFLMEVAGNETAAAWRERGVRVNSVSPGILATAVAHQELIGEHGPYLLKLAENSPVGRIGTIREVTRAIEFLLDARSSYITGTDLLVDGGVTASLQMEGAPI